MCNRMIQMLVTGCLIMPGHVSGGLLFRSGFEPGTHLANESSGWVDIVGVDRSVNPPNDWAKDFGQHRIGTFRFQYAGGDTTQRQVTIEPDPTDRSNHVLRYWMKHVNVKPNASYGGKGRIQVLVGNISYVGDMERPTPGSRRIAEVLFDDDPSEVWVQAWGGANTIARALKTIEEKHPDRMADVSKKAKLFLIANQDNTCNEYILKKWPDALLVQSNAFGAVAYRWQNIMTPEKQEHFDADWMKTNILNGHGPLCSMYEAHGDGRFRSEGDSPAFMHLISVGLGSTVDPTYGGWGGRFIRADNRWRSAPDDRGRYKTILRWASAFQNDWAARADWCVKPRSQCNHNPVAVCNRNKTKRVLEISADPGSETELSARGSYDPDRDRLSYRWWVYKDAGSYWDAAPIQGADAVDATVTVPQQASGRTIHIILEVTDDGKPPLTAYRRIIIEVSGQPAKVPPDMGSDPVYLRTMITRLNGPPQETGRWAFYRGINLNGPAIEIDGNKWEGDEAPNFLCEDRAINSPHVRLRPPTNEARARMIHSFRWNGRASMTMTGVPQGTYAVCAYVWEDNNPEQFSVSVQGRIVARNHYSGVEGEWHRLGPWTVRVTNGSIKITSTGGAANFSGIEVWRRIDGKKRARQ